MHFLKNREVLPLRNSERLYFLANAFTCFTKHQAVISMALQLLPEPDNSPYIVYCCQNQDNLFKEAYQSVSKDRSYQNYKHLTYRDLMRSNFVSPLNVNNAIFIFEDFDFFYGNSFFHLYDRPLMSDFFRDNIKYAILMTQEMNFEKDCSLL